MNSQRPALSIAEQAVTAGCQQIAITCTAAATAVCVCVHTRVCVCVRTRVRAHACSCVRACVLDMFAIYDTNICPRLIMIIIKIIILNFIQIRHTDAFPSTGTRLVEHNQLNNRGTHRVLVGC